MTQAAYLRELRAKAKAEGRCSMCRARPAREGLNTCEACAEQGSKRKKAENVARLSMGVCTQCRGPVPVGRTWFCMDCKPLKQGSRQSQVMHQAAVRKASSGGGVGKCDSCNGKAVSGMLYCARHGREYAAELRASRENAA